MAQKSILTEIFSKIKYVLDKYVHDSRQLLPLNKNLDYYRFFSRKFAYFGIIGVLWSKITILTIIPTQFSSLNLNLRTKMTFSQQLRIWKLPWYWSNYDVVNFQLLYFCPKVIFDQKFKLSDENWVGIMVNIVIFDHRTPIIPKWTNLREKNW